MKFLKYKQIVIGGGLVLFFCIIAFLAPYISPHDFWRQNLLQSLSSPSSEYYFGTDNYGRDIFSRVLYGARISLISASGAAAVASIIGVSLGILAGYFGGIIDRLVQTGIDIAWSYPSVLLAILIGAIMGPGLNSTVLAIAAVYWAQYARVIRGEVLMIKDKEYVEAARSLGCSHFRIIIKHIFPNVIPSMLVLISITMGYAMLLEAMMSFLGVGVQPPIPSWGVILAEGRDYMTTAPWITIFPGIIITFTVLGFNFLGDGLRDYLDPHIDIN